MAYIYVIENDINNKKYVGKTNFSLKKRFNEHIKDSTKRRVEKRPLYNAMNKYGTEHFHIKLIEEVDPMIASEKEQYWIDFYDTYKNGYNATKGGDGKSYLDYKKILELFDNTSLSQKEIAEEIGCCIDSVANIVSQYRENVNWQQRYSQSRDISETHQLHSGLVVKCVETDEIFSSATSAANWLIKNQKIKSQAYGRNKIPMACRGERKTVGGFHWVFV